jgi:polar amino acid transport system permease protein
MTNQEIVEHLITWSPFMFGGFGMNILISMIAVTLGTLFAWLFALACLSDSPRLSRFGKLLTSFFRNIPTLAFVFYAALVIPNEFYLPGTKDLVAFPTWLKAAIALSAGQIGLQVDQFVAAIGAWRRQAHDEAMLVLPNWFMGFLMTVLASSASSLVGVGELVSRSNTVINVSSTHLMVPVYLYASLIFIGFCLPMSWLVLAFKKRLIGKLVARGVVSR